MKYLLTAICALSFTQTFSQQNNYTTFENLSGLKDMLSAHSYPEVLDYKVESCSQTTFSITLIDNPCLFSEAWADQTESRYQRFLSFTYSDYEIKNKYITLFNVFYIDRSYHFSYISPKSPEFICSNLRSNFHRVDYGKQISGIDHAYILKYNNEYAFHHPRLRTMIYKAEIDGPYSPQDLMVKDITCEFKNNPKELSTMIEAWQDYRDTYK